MEEQINFDRFKFNGKRELKPINGIKALYVYTTITKKTKPLTYVNFIQTEKEILTIPHINEIVT